VFVRFCGFVPLYALGLAQPLVGTHIDVVPMLVLLIGTTWGYVIHVNSLAPGPAGVAVCRPNFHHWHHTKKDHINKNYASMLPVLDLLFGSAYMPISNNVGCVKSLLEHTTRGSPRRAPFRSR